jgi:hypothetical protein
MSSRPGNAGSAIVAALKPFESERKWEEEGTGFACRSESNPLTPLLGHRFARITGEITACRNRNHPGYFLPYSAKPKPPGA